MSEATERIQKLLKKSDRTPWGPECGALLAEAISVADAAGEEQYGYAARMRQCVNASILDDNELLLATFATCERLHSRDPLAFPADPGQMKPAGQGYGYSDLYWVWKWIPGVLRVSPDFPAEAIEGALEDLADAYVRAGLPEKTVVQRRLGWAIDRGDTAEALHWVGRLSELPDDEHSDCPACSRSRIIEALLLGGDDDGALALLEEIATEGYDCAEEPAVAYSLCLDALAHAGQTHRVNSGVAAIFNNSLVVSESVSAVARLVVFLTRNGEPGRALALARRTLPRIVEAPLEVAAHEQLLAAVSVAARAVAASGQADAGVGEADAPGLVRYLGATPPGGHTVATLAEASELAARGIAARFDRRSGTGAHSANVEELLRDDVRYDLPLVLPVDPDAAFADAAVGAEALFRVDDPVVAEPVDASDLHEVLFNLAHFGRPGEALEVGARWLPRLEAPLDRSLVLHRMAVATIVVSPGADADDLAAGSLDALREAGHSDVADAMAALGRFYYDDPVNDAQAATIRESVAALERTGAAPELVGLAITMAPAAFAGLDPDAPKTDPHLSVERAMELMKQSDAVIDRLGRPAPWAQRSMGGRHNLLVFRGELDEAALTELLADLRGPLTARSRVAIAEDRADMLRASGEVEEALAVQLDAYRETSRWGSALVRAAGAVRLASFAQSAGRVAEVLAIGAFLERLAPTLPPEEAGRALLMVAESTEAVERYEEALGQLRLAESLLGVLDEPEHGLLGYARRGIARVLSGARQDREAAQGFLAAAESFELAGMPDEAAESALFSSYAELRLGNVVAAGQLAEAVLESLPGLARPWGPEMSARHVIADAAGRAGVADADVEAAFADALAVAARADDPGVGQTSRGRVLLTLAEWLHGRSRYVEAAEAARESREISRGLEDVRRRDAAALALAWALAMSGDTEGGGDGEGRLAEARAIVVDLLADPDPDERTRHEASRIEHRLNTGQGAATD